VSISPRCLGKALYARYLDDRHAMALARAVR
jgi:hypothetical protein